MRLPRVNVANVSLQLSKPLTLPPAATASSTSSNLSAKVPPGLLLMSDMVTCGSHFCALIPLSGCGRFGRDT